MASRKSKPKTGRPAKLPWRLTVIYRKRLLRIVAKFKQPVMAIIARYEKAQAHRGDAVGKFIREDAKTITRILGGVGVELDTIVQQVRPNLLSQDIGKQVQAFTLEEVNEALKGAWRGVVTIKPSAVAVRKDLTRFVRDNVALIKSIPKQLHAQVRAEIEEAWSVGRDPAVLRARLVERLRVTESRARLIARDQVQKLHSAVTQSRHKQLGIERYTWSVVGDERVRGRHGGLYPDAVPSHWDRDGKIYRYDDPPEGGHPGEAIQCRCIAVPIIPDDLPDDDEVEE